MRDAHGKLVPMARPPSSFDDPGEFPLFTSEDASLPPMQESVHTRRQRKPAQRWDPDPADPMSALRKGARIEDARASVAEMVPEPGARQPQKRSIFGRVQQAQFGVVPGLDEVHQGMIDNPPSKVPPSSSLMDRPGEYVTQDNWQPGMGDTWAERHLSPKTRARGHLLAAGALFVASMPPLIDRVGRVTEIRY